MEIKEIIQLLKKPFPPELHKERKLPGGGRWFFIPWQEIRERLDEVYPEWECAWSEPSYLGKDCIIQCTITIAGISRSAPGNAQIELLSSSGKDMSRGTPVERAVADAFKNAAEAWGVARYLDNQDFVVNFMSKNKDMRAYKFATENNQISAGARGQAIKPNSSPTPKPKTKAPTPAPKEQALYPGNNELIRTVRTITGHSPGWIIGRCKQHGGTKPDDTLKIWNVIFEMCGQYAATKGRSDIESSMADIQAVVFHAQQRKESNISAVVVSWLENLENSEAFA